MSEGKSFQIHAPATGKARRPTIPESLMAGTNRLLLVEDHSLCLDLLNGCRGGTMLC